MMPSVNGGAASAKGIIWVLLYCLMVLPVQGVIAPPSPASAASDAPASGDQELVRRGIDLFKEGKLDQSKTALESAELVYPDNNAVPYYLGLIYLKQGQKEAAITQWRKYVAMAPQSENTLAIRKHITLLLRKSAKESAQKAVARESALLKGPVDENTVAVSAFKSIGSDELGPLGKGMAAMIIADIAQFKDLKVVERERLQALLAEMKLGASGLVDSNNAPRVGRLLRAKYVTTGIMTSLEKKDLQVASVLLDAALNAPMGSQEAQGRLKKFYELEKEIACRIIADLGRDCKNAPEAFEKIHTKSLPALAAYSQGLDYADADKYDEARIEFQKALEEDPDFDLAQAALLAAPAAAMLLLTEAQIFSSASSGAPPAGGTTAAAASTTASTTASTAASASGGGGGVSIGTMAYMAGGAVLVGGAVVGVKEGLDYLDDKKSDSPTNPNPLTGRWSGSWSNPQSGAGGNMVVNITQNGNSYGGAITLEGNPCLPNADINSGSLDNSQVRLDVASAEAGAVLNGNVDLSARSMDGTINMTSGACTGTVFNYNIAK